MRFAYHPSMCDPSFYLELGKAAEKAGFDVITFPDSICYPKECDSTYPIMKMEVESFSMVFLFWNRSV